MVAELAPFAGLLLGLIIGSFLNVVILRLPKRMQAELNEACADQRPTDGAEERGVAEQTDVACP